MRRFMIGALLALAALAVLPSASHAALQWRSCVDFAGIRCATLDVPLDRANTMPGTIPLRIARIGKTSGKTMMYLSGGPGGAGVSEMLSVVGSALPELAEDFQLIGYDQRGTGRSGLLRCPRLEKDPHLRDTGAAEECANRIGPARRFYTTPDSVQDMEAIRQQLGVEKLTLFGISYGTELAVAYARAFPAHVERLILDSVVDYDDPDPFAGVTFRAMSPSLKSLCPARCREISLDPGADLTALVAQLRAKPLQAFAYDSLGRSQRVNITPTKLFDLMLLTDYLPPLRAAIPAGVQAALKGDGALLARLIRESRRLEGLGSPRDFSVARYSTVCETTPLPWPAGTPVEQRAGWSQSLVATLPPNAFAPFDAAMVVEDEINLCLRWPDVPRAPTTVAPTPYPTVPTLILQGGEDLRTAPEWSANVAARIPGAHRIVIPGVGHSTLSEPRSCAARAVSRFLDGKTPPKTCKRVPTGVPGGPSAPKSFDKLASYPDYSGKVGRTLFGVFETLNDLDVVFSTALATGGGGLRGGSWRISGRRLVLHDYQAVTGLTVSGGGDLSRSLTFRISGPKAAKGRLVLGRRGLSGTLGGKRIRLSLSDAQASLLQPRLRVTPLSALAR
ncbi:alpha/beta hydrolase [Solirubrobacter phytolaccae]|uniref:Alpha/beta hydrolase n=1 Tax=Solirubrobacter phytolaccae TaxID=1404360 RepID=A0A9X3NCC2_9ACTN|nr:alpha/beta fold hydrolase [Solirubrobacter phytolaccae]MDA0182167.1 alpha/beta hydrolase [Solirubrobacter phytolaccae]